MPSFSSSTLSIVLLVAGYLNNRCVTPPNETTSPHTTDRVRFLTTTPTLLFAHVASTAVLYQALVTLFSTDSPADHETLVNLCPYPSHLDPSGSTVSWNPRTVGYLSLVAIGAFIRLGAYGGLGRNFTYQLAKPDRLITSGLYKYLQHPSYTGIVLLLAGYGGLVVNRFDTPIACLLPEPLLGLLKKWELGLLLLAATVLVLSLIVRIRDEERMLREKFGREWEIWHKKTARIVPWIL
ncbi:methyltransferase family protein [Aspergillus foveolatus]|uniref:methyltransferase family protein n=1 Tax=Aspergillus foveolatus TaxID=210207 RepID=UPI003CCDD384